VTYTPKFGVAGGVSKRESLDSVAEFAAEAETLGFNSFWLQDNPLTTRDPYMALEVVARRTVRILLGPGVSTPATRHPAVIANSIMTLNDESDGRAFLGIGSGGPSLLQPLGIESRRAKAFRLELEQIVTLLRGEEVTTADGRHYRVGRSPSSIPVISAASGDMMLRASGALADGVLLAGPAIIDRYREHTVKAHEAATAAGRDPANLTIHILLNVSIDNEQTRGIDQAKPVVASWIHSGFVTAETVSDVFAEAIEAVKERHDPSRHLASGPDADAVPDELVQAVAVAGNRDQCQRQLAEILKLQPAQIVITVPARNRLNNLRAIASVIESASVR
jgi:5,10-methylenetetrahydromethanopterin reductase